MAQSRAVERATLWLTKLSLLTVGGGTAIPKQQILLLAHTLAAEFPENVFSDESLGEAASAYKFFPSYAELKEILCGWITSSSPSNPTGRRVSKLSGVP